MSYECRFCGEEIIDFGHNCQEKILNDDIWTESGRIKSRKRKDTDDL